MARSDRHDARQFEHYAKLDDAGVVVSTLEIAVGSELPNDAIYVLITDAYPYDFDGAQVALHDDAPLQIEPPFNGDSGGIKTGDAPPDPPVVTRRTMADIRADLLLQNKVARA